MKIFQSVAAAALLSKVRATIKPSSLITVTTAADNTNAAAWWTPLDEFGDYAWISYVRNPTSGSKANNNVMVVRRSLSDGAIQRDCLKDSSTGDCVLFVDDAGHNQPSLAVDGDGYVHVFTSMHHNSWRYYRSAEPFSVDFTEAGDDMPDQDVFWTYPVIKRDAAGDLWLIIRGGPADDMEARSGYLFHYDTSAKSWTRVSRWAHRSGYSVYPDDIQFSSDGDVHLQWEWSQAPASAGRHEGSYIRYRPSTGKFKTITGQEVAVPVTQDTPNVVFQPLTSGETYGQNGSPPPLFQSAKLALYEDSAGSVHVQSAYRFQNETDGTWQVRRARSISGGNSWSREIVFADVDTSAAVGFTHYAGVARIYYCRIGGSVWVLEKDGDAAWTNNELVPAKGKKVQRLQAIVRSDGVDTLYLGAPTNVDASTGSVYTLTVGGRS